MSTMTPSRPDAADAVLKVQNLTIDFKVDRKTTTNAIQGISFDIGSHETVALVGESGSGKSVTSLAIMGLLPPESAIIRSGAIHFDGRDLLKQTDAQWLAMRGSKISMIFQDPMTSLNPVMRVGRQITEILQLHRQMSAAEADKKAVELLDEVGIVDAAAKVQAYPHQMSGGQQQRVMIAMALACEPQLLIADEPTTALDVTIQRQILELLAQLQRTRKMSVLFITHDLALVREIADRVVVMRHGTIREAGRVADVFAAPQDAYTRALLACRPPSDGKPYRLPVIEDFLAQTDSAASIVVTSNAAATPPLATVDRLAAPAILKVEGLNTHYYDDGLFKRRSHHVVKNASFSVPKGTTLGIVGESGSGKTTLGMTVLRMIKASSGKVWFDGTDILSLSAQQFMAYKRRMQLIFQNPLASLNPRFTIRDVLLEPLTLHQIGADQRERVLIAEKLLDRVGLPQSALNKYPHEFSGGQCQRIAIARCLTLKPEVLVCDESVSALDVSVQAQVLNLLKDLQEEFGLTYLFISHDLSVVRYISDQIAVMQHGDIVELGASEQIFTKATSDYTKALIEAMPGRGLVRAADRHIS